MRQTRVKRTGGAFRQALVKNVLKIVAWKGNEPWTFGRSINAYVGER